MKQACRHTGLLLAVFSLVACGGGGGSAPPVTPPPAVDPIAALEARLDDLNVTDYAIVIGSRPPAIDNNNVDFRYALGHWRECGQPVWDSSCDSRRLSSSPGAFGWNPWIDFDNGYYGIIAMQEALVDGGSPTDATLAFAMTLRPLIIAALPQLRARR